MPFPTKNPAALAGADRADSFKRQAFDNTQSDLAPSDAHLIACDFVCDIATNLCLVSAALVAAASSADLAGVEARLWQARRCLTEAIRAWREAVPPLDARGGGND